MLERVVIRGNVQLESRLLGAFTEHNISLLLLSGRHSKATAMLAGRSHSDSMRRLGQYRLSSDMSLRLPFAVRLVLMKVQGQSRFLRAALVERPDLRHALSLSLETLSRILQQLEGIQTVLPLETLRGLEGAAAAAYFKGYTQLFAESLNFTGRRKRPPPDPVNVCLSLGYTLLHYDGVRAIHQAGLDPMLGFFHDLSFGWESLACDLIEPVRPVIDRWVWRLFRERCLRVEHFSYEAERCLLGKTGRQLFYGCYESEAGAARRLLRRYGYALAKQCLALYEAV